MDNQTKQHLKEMKQHANNMLSSMDKMEKSMNHEGIDRNFPMKGMVKEAPKKEVKHSGEIKLHY